MLRKPAMILTAAGLAAAVALGSPASSGAATTPTAVSPPSSGAATGTTAASWNYIRSTCRVLPAGTVCLSLLGNGQPSTYHLNLTFAPKPGQWFKRLSLAEWRGKNYWEFQSSQSGTTFGRYNGTTYRPICSGGVTSCAQTTSTQTYVIPTRNYAVYTVLFDTPQGRYDVNAGVTVPQTANDSDCFGVYGTSAAWSLTSRNNNMVYIVQHLQIRTPLRQPAVVHSVLTNNRKAIHTYPFTNVQPNRTYVEPRSLVTPWQRTTFQAPADLQEPSVAPDKTFWRTQTVSAYSNDENRQPASGCVM